MESVTGPGILSGELSLNGGDNLAVDFGRRRPSIEPISSVFPSSFSQPSVRLSRFRLEKSFEGLLKLTSFSSTLPGDVHRRQRKILLPSFSPSSIRALVPAMLAKAHELSKAISLESSKDPKREMEISRWLSKATLDIIGKTGERNFGRVARVSTPFRWSRAYFDTTFFAGFDFDMQSLDPNSRNPLSEAYMEAGLHGLRMDARQILTSVFPVLRRLVSSLLSSLRDFFSDR